MIKPRQIRAARHLLGLDAEQLAEKAGVTRATITNIENGVVQPQRGSLERIVGALTQGGIEFIGDRGVALANQSYKLIEGPDCYIRLLDQIYHPNHGYNHGIFC